MSTPIENARKRLAALRVEAAEIERFIAMYERFDDKNVSWAQPSNVGNSEETHPQKSKPVDNLGRDGPRPTEIAEMMERLIREVGRPMTRGEIVSAFAARDFEIPGTDKGRYLGTIAWRNKGKFVNIEGRGYWVRSLPLVEGKPTSHLFSEVEEPDIEGPEADPVS
jgi:hypothetical protein